ncbi:MAG TPA: proton-conducting transporter membrane subunit, partial [Anaerolineae bacterium]
ISQLGFMFAALGIGAYIAAIFHLLTHAFFKALLFMGSGSVIHGMEHGHHEAAHAAGHGASAHAAHNGHDVHGAAHDEGEPFDPQNMRNMGGLIKGMPRTGWTFIIGGLALSGFPFVTAGFWSKDEILADAWVNGHHLVFYTLAVAALLTAFYTARQIWMTFFGEPRTPAAAAVSAEPGHGERDSIFAWMTTPLLALAFFAVVGGWIGIPGKFPLLGAVSSNPFLHFMGSLAQALEIEAEELPFHPLPLLTSLVVALGGLTLGYLVYRSFRSVDQPDPLAAPLGPLYPVLQNKYYFDELYDKVFIKPTQKLANWMYQFDHSWVIDPLVNAMGALWCAISEAGRWVDTNIVDGIVNGAGTVAASAGEAVRVIQTGKAQNYLLVGLISVSVLLAAFVLFVR